MRIISQDGTTDIPYEAYSFNISALTNNQIMAQINFNYTVIGEYKTQERAKEVLAFMHDAYLTNRVFEFFDRKEKFIMLETQCKDKASRDICFGVFRLPKE